MPRPQRGGPARCATPPPGRPFPAQASDPQGAGRGGAGSGSAGPRICASAGAQPNAPRFVAELAAWRASTARAVAPSPPARARSPTFAKPSLSGLGGDGGPWEHVLGPRAPVTSGPESPTPAASAGEGRSWEGPEGRGRRSPPGGDPRPGIGEACSGGPSSSLTPDRRTEGKPRGSCTRKQVEATPQPHFSGPPLKRSTSLVPTALPRAPHCPQREGVSTSRLKPASTLPASGLSACGEDPVDLKYKSYFTSKNECIWEQQRIAIQDKQAVAKPQASPTELGVGTSNESRVEASESSER